MNIPSLSAGTGPAALVLIGGVFLSFWRTRIRSCFNNSRDSSKFNMGCKV